MASGIIPGNPKISFLVIVGAVVILISLVTMVLPHNLLVQTTGAGIALLVAALGEAVVCYYNPEIMNLPKLAIAVAAVDAIVGVTFLLFQRSFMSSLGFEFGLVFVVLGILQMISGRVMYTRGMGLAPVEALIGLLICLLGVMFFGDMKFAWFAPPMTAILRGVTLIIAGYRPNKEKALASYGNR